MEDCQERLGELFLAAEVLLEEAQGGNGQAVAALSEKLTGKAICPGRAISCTPEPADIPPWNDPRNPLELRKKELAVKREVQKQLESASDSSRHEWLRERFG